MKRLLFSLILLPCLSFGQGSLKYRLPKTLDTLRVSEVIAVGNNKVVYQKVKYLYKRQVKGKTQLFTDKGKRIYVLFYRRDATDEWYSGSLLFY
jgi:hypothetical protein